MTVKNISAAMIKEYKKKLEDLNLFDILHYVKCLEETLKNQKDITSKAINKIKQLNDK